MYHLFKAEIAKLLKSKSFLICCIVVAGLGCVLVGSYAMMKEMYSSEAMTQVMEQVGSEGQSGVHVEMQKELGMLSDMTGQNLVELSFSGNTIQILLAVLVGIFVCSEFSGGAMKSIASRGFSRVKIYAVKYIVSIFGGELLAVVCVSVMALGGSLLWGFGDVSGSFWEDFAKFLLIQFLLNAALAGFMVCISFILRNVGISIAANIGVLMFATLGLTLIDLIIDSDSFSVGDYWIGNLINQASTFALSNSVIERSVIVSLVMFVLSFVVGAVFFKNSDVK